MSWLVLNGVKQTDAANQIANLILTHFKELWKYSFFHDSHDSQQGKYQRQGVFWQNEDLNKSASKFVRENACLKGNQI